MELAKYMKREKKEKLIPKSFTFKWDVLIGPNLIKKFQKKITKSTPFVLKYDGSSSGNDVYFIDHFNDVHKMIYDQKMLQEELPFLDDRRDSINGWRFFFDFLSYLFILLFY